MRIIPPQNSNYYNLSHLLSPITPPVRAAHLLHGDSSQTTERRHSKNVRKQPIFGWPNRFVGRGRSRSQSNVAGGVSTSIRRCWETFGRLIMFRVVDASKLLSSIRFRNSSTCQLSPLSRTTQGAVDKSSDANFTRFPVDFMITPSSCENAVL